jgi:hypothetical protein
MIVADRAVLAVAIQTLARRTDRMRAVFGNDETIRAEQPGCRLRRLVVQRIGLGGVLAALGETRIPRSANAARFASL